MKLSDKRSVGCVVLAAGNARRFGANKLGAVLGGKTLMEHALDALPVEALETVCVVTQYDAVEALARRRGFGCVRNEHPDEGLSRSVRLGTEALADRCEAIVYLVSDQPLLRRESVLLLLEQFRAYPDCIIAAARDGRRGNPCLFPARFFPELCALSGDVGGSAVIRAHPEALRLCELPAEELADVDTRRALEELRG